MAKKRLPEPSLFQLRYEKCLLYAVWILGTFYLLLSVFRYAIDYAQIRPYVRWYAVALLASIVVYLFITWINYPETAYRLKAFFSGMKSYEMIFMAALLCWFVIVCAVRQMEDRIRYFKFGDWWLLDTAILSFVFFPFFRYTGREKAVKALSWMLHIIVLSYTVYVGWCLWNVFHLNIVTLPSGSQVGMTKRLQLNLGCYYNITGALSFVVFALACYMIATQKPVLKAIYSIAAAIQLYAALLSNSRTVYISLLFLTGTAAFFTGWYKLKNRKITMRLVVSVAVASLAALLIWWLRSACFEWFDSYTHFSALVSGDASLSVLDNIRELDGLSGREAIWIASLKIMASSPLAFFFGVTPFQVSEALQTIGGLEYEFAHAHNVILQFGASFGVPAMLAFIYFVFRILIKCVTMLLDLNSPEYSVRLMIPITVASLLLMNLAEAYLVAYFSIMSCVFFLFCGFVTVFHEPKHKTGKKDKGYQLQRNQ